MFTIEKNILNNYHWETQEVKHSDWEMEFYARFSIIILKIVTFHFFFFFFSFLPKLIISRF